jgi:YbgC/YbaW family acyl-CoA thioester hydrolase
MVEHALSVQVRWSDADPAGIAFYPRFFEWYDMGTEALFASLGLVWAETFPRHGIVGVPVLETGSRFVSPVRYGDMVTVRTRVAWVREKTFRVEHDLSVGDRACAAGYEVRAWVARPRAAGDRLRAVPIPAEVLARLGGESAGAVPPPF